MIRLAALAFVLAPLSAQSLSWTPKYIVTGGGGFASPSGKFAYASESTYVGQGTYATVAQEYTTLHGQVESCTFGGASKLLYQWSLVTVGLTGLGGGCQSTNGSAGGAASGQGFLDVRWGKLPFGNTITAEKTSVGGFKITVGFHFSP